MSDDLIKRLSEYDKGKINDARQKDAARIEQLERELDAALAAQDYTYIGKDMKPILARDLEDAKDAAEAKLAKAVKALRWYDDHCTPKYAGEVLAKLEGK